MHRRPFLILATLASAAACFLSPASAAEDIAPAAAETPAAKTIRIVSWNIEWYPGKRPNARGEEMAAHAALVRGEMPKLAPDILLTQEMRDWNSFARLCDTIRGLRPVTVSAFTSEESGEYWRQQLGIGSKLPVTAAWSEPWTAGAEITPRRGFSCAAVRLPGGYDLLLVYNVHLKSNRAADEAAAQLNYRTREESVRQLLAHIREMEERVFKGNIAGIVVGGDFNTNHDGQFGDDRTIDMMTEAGFHNTWKDVPREERLTWRGSDRFVPTTFDYIFTKGLPETRATLIPVDDGASDHWPVMIELNP